MDFVNASAPFVHPSSTRSLQPIRLSFFLGVFFFLLFSCSLFLAHTPPNPCVLRVPSLLALVVEQMAVPGSGPGELRPAVGAGGFRSLARLLALVPQQVAEGRELAAVAPMLPTLGLGPALHHPDVTPLVAAARRHDCWHLVHHSLLLTTRQ
jgi:hypothetical protein